MCPNVGKWNMTRTESSEWNFRKKNVALQPVELGRQVNIIYCSVIRLSISDVGNTGVGFRFPQNVVLSDTHKKNTATFVTYVLPMTL